MGRWCRPETTAQRRNRRTTAGPATSRYSSGGRTSASSPSTVAVPGIATILSTIEDRSSSGSARCTARACRRRLSGRAGARDASLPMQPHRPQRHMAAASTSASTRRTMHLRPSARFRIRRLSPPETGHWHRLSHPSLNRHSVARFRAGASGRFRPLTAAQPSDTTPLHADTGESRCHTPRRVIGSRVSFEGRGACGVFFVFRFPCSRSPSRPGAPVSARSRRRRDRYR